MYDSCNRRIHYLRVSVTDRCNLRCLYCMPAAGVTSIPHVRVLRLEEIREVVASAVALGIDKVRLTGGEPLVRSGIVELVAMLSRIEGIQDLAMTTNGTLLPRHAAALKAAGLHRLNVSLDAIDPSSYRLLSRCGRVEQVLAGLAAADAAGFTGTKLNCVIERSADERDAREVAAFAAQRGYALRFIPRMHTARGEFGIVEAGGGGDCARCNRLRLSSDGLIRPCLFADQAYDVRALGAEAAIRAAVAGKPANGERSTNHMYAIGG